MTPLSPFGVAGKKSACGNRRNSRNRQPKKWTRGAGFTRLLLSRWREFHHRIDGTWSGFSLVAIHLRFFLAENVVVGVQCHFKRRSISDGQGLVRCVAFILLFNLADVYLSLIHI